MDVIITEKWLNQTDNKSIPPPYGNGWNKGVVRSKLFKQKIREANLGKRLSDIAIQKLRKPKSEETKQKMSEAKRRKETRTL